MDSIKRLETYRLENKITQQKLAQMLGVSFCTINRWLTGKFKPNKIQSYHIEKFLATKKKGHIS
jgi:transcriptional regulator with XRE-family HTH domain